LPSAWGSGAHRWSEASTSVGGVVKRTAGGLAAGACYSVSADGASLGSFRADSSGRIVFNTNRHSGTVNFAIQASPCRAAAPIPAVRLPLILR
jgi:hypothetical protein